MNPTDEHRSGRDGAPTIREIAELTARLRELSAPGRRVDPRERAAFLTDKDALVARITDAQDDPSANDGRGTRHHHDERSPVRVGDVQMPDWMREQAAHTEAAVVAGTAPPVRGDERVELAARVEALHEQAGRDTDPPGCLWEREHPTRAVPSCLVEVDEEQARREQLTRWHTDDTDTDTDTDTDEAGAGPRDVWRGPSLP